MSPTKQQHAQRCCENHTFHEAVARHQIDSNEWRVIALFYSALQAVDAYLAAKQVQTISHTDRGGKLRDQINSAKAVEVAAGQAAKSARKDGDAVAESLAAAEQAAARTEHAALAKVSGEYSILKALSHRARYSPPQRISDVELGAAQDSHRIVCERLQPLVAEPLAMFQ